MNKSSFLYRLVYHIYSRSHGSHIFNLQYRKEKNWESQMISYIQNIYIYVYS